MLDFVAFLQIVILCNLLQLRHEIQSQSYKSPETRMYDEALCDAMDGSDIEQPSFSSDVWSLGCLLFHAFTGRKLFEDCKIFCNCSSDVEECMIQVQINNGLQMILSDDDAVVAQLKDLIASCLRCKSRDRTSAQQILRHGFVSSYSGLSVALYILTPIYFLISFVFMSHFPIFHLTAFDISQYVIKNSP